MISVSQIDSETYQVEVDGPPVTTHLVTLPDAIYRRMTERRATPEGLIMQSFRFLLERESNTQILAQFALTDIERYFPEWEDAMLDWLEAGR